MLYIISPNPNALTLKITHNFEYVICLIISEFLAIRFSVLKFPITIRKCIPIPIALLL